MNEAIFAVLKKFVEKTLNQSFADIAALLATENNEIRSDASEILNGLLINHIESVKANIDITQHPKHKELLSNARIEYKNKMDKEVGKTRAELEAQYNALKESKTSDEIKHSELVAAEKLSGDARVQAAKLELEKYIADQTAKARKSLLEQKFIENLPVKEFMPVLPKVVNLAVREVLDERVFDFTEKDGKIYALDANKNLITRPNGHALTLQDIGKDVLASISTPLVQPPISGSGNTTESNPVFKGW